MGAEQQSLRFRQWGGRRRGAGRPRTRDPGVTHDARPKLAKRYPVHATLRAAAGVPNLRRMSVYATIEAALVALLARADFRVVHFCVQTNHVHLILEASDARALSQRMQALAIRIARGVNRATRRRGKIWAGRYHARTLRTPREVRNAICYVLQNTRRHDTSERVMVDPSWVDPRSSGSWFDGWKRLPEGLSKPNYPPTSEPRTWLLAPGWRRYGLIRVDEVPPAAFG